jgi:hypothetical protein
MSSKDLLVWEIWYYDVFKMKQACTSSIQDGKDLLLSLRLQDQDPTELPMLMAMKYPFLGISSTYTTFIPNPVV